MKKLLSILFVLLLGFALVACNEDGTLNLDEFPTFDEDQMVEMSPQQISQLLQAVDMEAAMNDTVRIHIEGSLESRNTSSYEDFYYDYDTQEYVEYLYSSTNEQNLTIDATMFLQLSELVEEAVLMLDATFDIDTLDSSNWYNEPETYTFAAAGTLSMYMIEQYFYLSPNMTVTQDGVEETYDFKQKLTEMITQEMFDEMFEGVFSELQENPFVDVEDLEEEIDQEQLDELLDAIPNLKVYQNGTMTTIIFEVTKQDIIDSTLDFIIALSEMVGEELPPQEQLDDMVQEFHEQINSVVEELAFRYSITIQGTELRQIAIEVNALIDDEDMFLDIDMKLFIDFGLELPARPNDLDEYVPVDEFDMLGV
ncbi:MAG: hypothetical protein ACNA7K_03450 [Acholeplasmataceae bacterium]